MKRVLVLAAAWLALVAGQGTAAPIQTYNDSVGNWTTKVGSGQFDGFFSVARDVSFSGGSIQLGLRAVERQNTPGITAIAHPQGPANALNLYMVQSGPQTNPLTPNRAWWNFDIAVDYPTISTLDALTLTIERLSGDLTLPTASSFDLKSAQNTPVEASGTQGDDTLFRASQNPVFAPWFVPAYDMNAEGLYRFTLSATENGQSISTSMLVNVSSDGTIYPIPEPTTFALFGLIGGAFVLRRRKATSTL